jgi:hypothetical protein
LQDTPDKLRVTGESVQVGVSGSLQTVCNLLSFRGGLVRIGGAILLLPVIAEPAVIR